MIKQHRYLFLAFLLILSLSCTAVSGIFGEIDPNDPGLDPKEQEEIQYNLTQDALVPSQPIFQTQSAIETDQAAQLPQPTKPPAVIENPGAETSKCEGIEVIEVDIRNDPELMPDAVVWANGELHDPPEGFGLTYPDMPDSQGYNDTWRIISHPGANIFASTSVPVSCAGVFIVGDYVSPIEVSVNGQTIYEGFPYPAEGANRPTRFFYIRTEVNPADLTFINITGYAPEDSTAAYVPVLFFGFDLP